MLLSRRIGFYLKQKKEDKLIITGLTSKTPMPTNSDDKRKWLNTIVGEVLEMIVPDSSKHIIFTLLGSRNAMTIPLVEVKMDSKELATKIRKEFSTKGKGGFNFGRVFVANSVTLATRVRVDILKAMAKHYTSDSEIFPVSAFVSKPVHHVRSKADGLRLGTYNFPDALIRYGENLTAGELGEAYKRAGSAFRGQLQQNFVVLNEKGVSGDSGSAKINGAVGGACGTPRKQLREGGGGVNNLLFDKGNKAKIVKKIE
jgi:hypothetical protein